VGQLFGSAVGAGEKGVGGGRDGSGCRRMGIVVVGIGSGKC